MHRVRAWAHHAARENSFNPWAAATTTQPSSVAPSVRNHATLSGTQQEDAVVAAFNPGSESEKEKPVIRVPLARRVWRNVERTLFHSWINVLLVFVPAGIAVHFAGVNPNVVFALNAIAIIPLAGLLTFATESVAHRLGPTLGALLNVSFGNAVELIIFIIALVKNEIRIVQASLIGSILANLLLILGMAFLIGGLEFQEQIYDATVTQMSACFLALSVLSLLMPTAFHVSFNDVAAADEAVLKVSRGTSVILLLMYVLYLLFQLKSHAHLYQGVPQHIINQQTEPGFLARFDTTSSSASTVSSRASIASSRAHGSPHNVRRRIKSKLGIRRKSKVEIIEASAATLSPAFGATPLTSAENTVSIVKLDTEPSSSGSMASPDLISTSSFLPAAAEDDHNEAVLVCEAKESGIRLVKTLDQPTQASLARPALRTAWSIRPPPVFRSDTSPDMVRTLATSKAQTQLRRMRSAPLVPQLVPKDIPRPPEQPTMALLEATENAEGPQLSQTASIVLLLCSTALVALCAEFLVGSIQHLVESSSLSEAFIGLIILPIVGNAAEHVTAVTVAAKNKLDLSLGVSLGSSIQIAIFVTPVVVILGWILDRSMSLYFNLFETAALFVSAFIVNFLVLDGRSNYLEGALLCACYVIIALGAFFFPDDQGQSSLTKGTGSTTH